jgi:hypothetical protein
LISGCSGRSSRSEYATADERLLAPYDELLALVQQQAQIEVLTAEVARLRADLEEARRAGKRQAAPFRKGRPKPNPKRPSRKAGDQNGPHTYRQPPPSEQIDEVLEAPLPDAGPQCRGTVTPTEVAQQYQTDLPRQPLRRQFNVHIGHCRHCGRRASVVLQELVGGTGPAIAGVPADTDMGGSNPERASSSSGLLGRPPSVPKDQSGLGRKASYPAGLFFETG